MSKPNHSYQEFLDIGMNSFSGLKGEFEGEGIARNDLIFEFGLSLSQRLSYLVKIGGCEAKSDVAFLTSIGVTAVTAPMIETPFAMSKFMAIDGLSEFSHIGVTIETIDAVNNVVDILEAGDYITDVTIGRSDLSRSLNVFDVESPKIFNHAMKVATIAKQRGLYVTLGGSIGFKTRNNLLEASEFTDLIDFVETRKVIMTTQSFLKDDALESALAFECTLLERQINNCTSIMAACKDRREQILQRLGAEQ